VDGLKDANGFDVDFFGVVSEAPSKPKEVEFAVVVEEEAPKLVKGLDVVVVLVFEEEAPKPKGVELVVVLEEDAPPKPKRLGLGAAEPKEKGLDSVTFPPGALSAADWHSTSFPSWTCPQFVTMTVSSGTCFSLVWSLPIISTMSMPLVTSPNTTCFPSN
jgi:hypothetical protein